MTIVITLPTFADGEAERIAAMLRSGAVDLVHIRKPGASAAEVERLVLSIPPDCRSRLVLHDHFQLAVAYHLHGVHLNSRNPQPPKGWQGSVSRSCHSLDEVTRWKERCRYVSLSPIFDSISKQDYHAAFSSKEIEQARQQGIIDRKVMALGGVTFGSVDEVLRMGFGGAMILGDAWKTDDRLLTPAALTIAGSDPSAGAGLQQDLKTMTALGVYAATVVTAVTSQNTMGVTDVLPLPASAVESQLRAVLTDLRVESIKIGMLPNAEVAHAVVSALERYKRHSRCAIVYDPVMVASSGRQLMQADCLAVVTRHLLPLCSLVTPNLPEADCLLTTAGLSAHDYAALPTAFGADFLIKGGHANGAEADDVLYCLTEGTVEATHFATERIATSNLHGTGCALSSAIAAHLLDHLPTSEAVRQAKVFVTQAIRRGQHLHIGHGNGPLMP